MSIASDFKAGVKRFNEEVAKKPADTVAETAETVTTAAAEASPPDPYAMERLKWHGISAMLFFIFFCFVFGINSGSGNEVRVGLMAALFTAIFFWPFGRMAFLGHMKETTCPACDTGLVWLPHSRAVGTSQRYGRGKNGVVMMNVTRHQNFHVCNNCKHIERDADSETEVAI